MITTKDKLDFLEFFKDEYPDFYKQVWNEWRGAES